MAQLITIQGQVVNKTDNTLLADVDVVAYQEGTVIKQKTDKDGKYEFHLAPGRWRIGVSATGFNEPDAYLYNFASDTKGIDFHLQNGYSISGLVVQQQGGKSVYGAIVEAEAVIEGETFFKRTMTDDSGEYHFSGLKAGDWQLKGSHGESYIDKKIQKLGPDADKVILTLARKMEQDDWRLGIGFFVALGGLLVSLLIFYLFAHSRVIPQPEPVLTAYTGQVDQAIKIVAETIKAGKDSKTSLQALQSNVTALKDNWAKVSKTLIFTTEGQDELATLFISKAEAAVTANNAQDLEAALKDLKSVLEKRPSIYFWYEPPWNYLEVIFWSLAGILVSLLITCGYYLRQKRFYAEGIWMHVSHLLSVPLLALVVVFLISQIKLTIKIDQSEIALNIRDPRLLAAVSFVIAVRPWAMIEFVREAGSSFFSQIQSRISGSQGIQTPKIDK